MKNKSLSPKGLKILALFMESPRSELSGAEIVKRTGMLTGTLYPRLIDFQQRGLLISRWEGDEAFEAGRPRRRLYKITGLGQKVFRSQVKEIFGGGLVWAPG